MFWPGASDSPRPKGVPRLPGRQDGSVRPQNPLWRCGIWLLGRLLDATWSHRAPLGRLLDATCKKGSWYLFLGLQLGGLNPLKLAPKSFKNRCEKTNWFWNDFFPFFWCFASTPTSKQEGQFCKKIAFYLRKITIFAVQRSSWSSKSGCASFSKIIVVVSK